MIKDQIINTDQIVAIKSYGSMGSNIFMSNSEALHKFGIYVDGKTPEEIMSALNLPLAIVYL